MQVYKFEWLIDRSAQLEAGLIRIHCAILSEIAPISREIMSPVKSDPLTAYRRRFSIPKWYLPFYTSDLMVVYNTT